MSLDSFDNNPENLSEAQRRLTSLEEKLQRATFRKRTVILERAYIRAGKALLEGKGVDEDYIVGLINLLKKWGRTTEQRFDRHAKNLVFLKTVDGTQIEKKVEEEYEKIKADLQKQHETADQEHREAIAALWREFHEKIEEFARVSAQAEQKHRDDLVALESMVFPDTGIKA